MVMDTDVVALADDLLLVLANGGRAAFLSKLEEGVEAVRAETRRRYDHKPYWWMPSPPL